MIQKTAIVLILLCCSMSSCFAQGWYRRHFPYTAINTQFAGSTGFISVGASAVSKYKKLEIGLLYGKVPSFIGNVNRSLTLKLNYSPVGFTVLKRLYIQPVTAGVFVCQNFNENLSLTWGDKYPRGYYWWSRSTRLHAFAGSQVSYLIDKHMLNRISVYFEANTNDLYLYSYIPNRKSMEFTDIIFFGTGIKFVLQKPH